MASTKIRYPGKLAGIAAVVAALAVAASGCSGGSTSPPTTGVSATSTTQAAPTTTTLAIPVAPQPSADVAANALVAAWASKDRATALRVATPGAVATLFAVTYPPGAAIARGCSSAFPPIVCTYGPPGGGSPNSPIFQISVSQAPGGWYVSSVMVEG